HGSYQLNSKQPDEQPLDWRRYVHAQYPGSKFQIHDLTPGREPEAPNTHQDRMDPGLRTMYWAAYKGAVLKTDAQQHSLAGDYHSFMAAQNSADLRALGFVMPSEGWNGDAGELTDLQQMAPGTTMASLFRKDGSINTSRSDDQAVANAAHAFK